MLRAAGYEYGELEREGILLVVHKIGCQYIAPATFDDLVTLTTRLIRITHARCDHEYELMLDEQLLAKGTSTLACIDRSGKLRRMPSWMVIDQD